MSMTKLVLVLCFFFAYSATALGQHCPPIMESYLSGISVQKSRETISFDLEYSKTGGQAMEAYQYYVVAYSDKDSRLVPGDTRESLIDPSVCLVLKTGLMEITEDGTYCFSAEFDQETMIKRMVTHWGLTEEDRKDYGGWGTYNLTVRLAVFVPFLEDEIHSTLDGLPDDKHECNYAGANALLFQELPYSMGIRFGTKRDKLGVESLRYFVNLNGSQARAEK